MYYDDWNSLMFLVWILALPPMTNPSTKDVGITSLVKYHTKYTPFYSPHKYELKQAYMAITHSVWNTLIHTWNETYKHFQNLNLKTIHYLSMEYLHVV